MTADSRFERTLPEILEDLYLGPAPDYRTEALAAAVRTRQRPSWTFAGRWLPMADIASRPAFAPRVPLRTIGMALAPHRPDHRGGRPRHRLAPDEGPAAFGLAATASSPSPGRRHLRGRSRERRRDPDRRGAGGRLGSDVLPDGTHIAFRRAYPQGASAAQDIIVVAADGSSPVLVTAKPIPIDSDQFEWAPDSQSLLVEAPGDSAIWLFDSRSQRHAADGGDGRRCLPQSL